MTGRHSHGGPECRELLAQLSDYIDGELDGVTCEHIDGHLEDCPPCRAFIESLRRTVRLLQRAPAEALPSDVRSELLQAYARTRHETRD